VTYLQDINKKETTQQFTSMLDEFDDKPKQSPKSADENQQKLKKAITHTGSVDFNCITSTRKGFILGGNRGIISIYEIEKQGSYVQIINTLSYEMRMPNEEDLHIYSVSSSYGDSIMTICSVDPYSEFQYNILNTLQFDQDVAIQPYFSAGFHKKKVNSITCAVTK
jgi:hypothetical protein